MADRGTVISSSGNRAFIMNEQCEFLEIKTAAPLQPGDRVEYSPRDVVRPGRLPVGALAVAASFIIVCLVAFTAFQHMLTGKVYAYIGMEINPGIEMGINRENKVVQLRGFNDEGKRLIEGRDLLNNDIREVLKIIIRDCRESKYLGKENDNDVAVSVHIPDGTDGHGLMKQVNLNLNAALAENGLNARMFFFNIDKSTMEQARNQDVSPLKYMLWEEARRKGYITPLQSVSLKDPWIKEIAGEKEQKITGESVTSVIEAPPSEGSAAAVPAKENREGRKADVQVSTQKKVQDQQPENDTPVKSGEPGNKEVNRAGKTSGQPDGEEGSSKNTSGDHREDKGSDGRPKALSDPSADKEVKPVEKDTVSSENTDSVAGEASGTGKTKNDADAVESGGSSSGGGQSGGSISGSGGGSGGSNSGSGGGTGGGSSSSGGSSGSGGGSGGGGRSGKK